MVGAVPFDWQAHDSYFVVAHLHYVLIGGVVFPIFAAIYYWMPKIKGVLLSERLGKWHFWLVFIGFHVAFFPQHILGLWGMSRRMYTYPEYFGWNLLNLISTIGAFILAAGVGVFVVNIIYSIRKGGEVVKNPWGANSIEWAVESPPHNFGFLTLPIIRSRFPLWSQKNLTDGPERLKALVYDFARWPKNWRAVMATTVLDGQPAEIFRVSGPSMWSFITAIGLVIVFGAEIFSLRPIVLLGLIMLVAGIVGWNWPEEAPTSKEEEEAFAKKHDIPVRPHGSRIVNRSAMWLLILLIGIALTSLLFSYLAIRWESAVWPQDNLPLPTLTWVGIGTLFMVANGWLLRWVVRQLKADETTKVRLGLLTALALEVIAAGLLVYDLSQLPFDWQINAYGSLFWTINGFVLLTLFIGIGMNLFVQGWTWKGVYNSKRFSPVENTAVYWSALIAVWIITVGFLYVLPYRF
jgi:cytochrome c oxidase subunit I+III